jgi:hypothetical protein
MTAIQRRYILPVIGIAVLLFGGWLLCSAINVSLEAERNLQAYIAGLNLVGRYVDANDGNWPRSWNDLQEVYDKSGPAERFENIKNRVSIDFNFDATTIRGLTTQTFKAVEPKLPCYEYEQDRQGLIDILWRHLSAKEASNQRL